MDVQRRISFDVQLYAVGGGDGFQYHPGDAVVDCADTVIDLV